MRDIGRIKLSDFVAHCHSNVQSEWKLWKKMKDCLFFWDYLLTKKEHVIRTLDLHDPLWYVLILDSHFQECDAIVVPLFGYFRTVPSLHSVVRVPMANV